MNALVLKNYLKEALSLTERVSGKNPTLPILSDVLIKADKGKINLRATNLEIGIEVEIPAKVETSGSLAVSAQTIYSFISNLHTDEYVKIEKRGDNLSIKTTNSETIIKGQPTEDFPAFPKIESKQLVVIPAQDFFSGLKSVWYASSITQIKPELSSVYITSKNKEMYFVATDSFRLAEKKVPYRDEILKGLLVPYRSVVEIIRILDGKTGDVKIGFDKNQLVLSIGFITFISRLVDGVFPDYEQILPKKIITDISLDKQSFLNTLKSASIFVNKLQEFQMSAGPKDGNLTIKTMNNDFGEHTASLQAQKTGGDFTIALNLKQVFDCLPYIQSEKILIRFSGENKPILITGTNNTSFQYLSMPVKNI